MTLNFLNAMIQYTSIALLPDVNNEMPPGGICSVDADMLVGMLLPVHRRQTV